MDGHSAHASLAGDVPLLEMRSVSKRYDGRGRALSEVSLKVAPGELVAVIGSSGAGKSTLLRCVNKLIDCTEGEILFEGRDIARARGRELRHARRRIAMIFQHYNLVYRATAIENVLQGRLGYKSAVAGMLGRYSEDEKRRAFEALDRVGMAPFAYKRADQLSGGQKQRVGIARALLQEPALMLADEPIASLDPKSSRTVMELLRWIATELRVGCLVNLHQVDFALEFSDRVVALKAGEVVFDGAPDRLTSATIAEIYGEAEPHGAVGPTESAESVEAAAAPCRNAGSCPVEAVLEAGVA